MLKMYWNVFIEFVGNNFKLKISFRGWMVKYFVLYLDYKILFYNEGD